MSAPSKGQSSSDTGSEGRAAQAPMERDPQQFGCGIYVVDGTGYGGARGFAWFADDQEALAWLRTDLPALFDDDDGMLARHIGKVTHGVERLQVIPLDALNDATTPAFTVEWAGTFDELLYSDHPFAREIQSEFYANVFGDERGMGPDGTITEDFAHHVVSHYSG